MADKLIFEVKKNILIKQISCYGDVIRTKEIWNAIGFIAFIGVLFKAMRYLSITVAVKPVTLIRSVLSERGQGPSSCLNSGLIGGCGLLKYTFPHF